MLGKRLEISLRYAGVRELLAVIVVCMSVSILLAGCGARLAVAPSAETGAPSAEARKVSTMEGYNSRFNPAHLSSGEAWELAGLNPDAVVMDVRSGESYEERRVSIAISVPFETVAEYAGANIPDKDRVIICYCFCDDKGGSALSARDLLAGLGYTNVYYMEPEGEWQYEGTSLTEAVDGSNVVEIVSGAEAKEIYNSTPGVVLLDVRNQDEYDAGHIEGSVLIPVAQLEGRLSELPDKGAAIIVYCKAGARSAAACEILIGQGYLNIYDMQSVSNWPG